jgi:hypothetical protein
MRLHPTRRGKTVPFPSGVVDGAPATAVHAAISAAAKELNTLRETW